MNRLQIMWVEIPDDEQYIKKELWRVCKELSKKYRSIFLQLGIVNEIICFDNTAKRLPAFDADMRETRQQLQKYMNKEYKFETSFRENMPQSTIIYDIQKTDDELLSQMHSWSKERVKKAIRNNISFRIAQESDYDTFYAKRVQLSHHKWFTPIPHKDYIALISYIQKHHCGELFIAEKDADIAAGSIYLYDAERTTYLYGFADRKYGNIGAHHFLTHKIMTWARDKGLRSCDMMGWAPTWFPEHSLTGVSTFKESLGGEKSEVFGSYDMIFHPWIYRMMRWIYRLKK